MPTAENDGVALAYERHGPPEAPTVVFVEGLGYGRWMWRWQREAVADDYDAIVWDNRGTGDSDVPEGPYTIADMAADLEAVLADAGVDAAHLVGASMGGMVVQEYALAYDRAESTALLCTSHGGPEAVPTPDETLARMFDVPEAYDEREAIRYKMQPAMTESFFEANDDLISDVVDWRLESDAPEPARQAQAAAVQAFDAADRLDGLDVPVLVMHGTDDRVLPVENARLLHEKLPDGELALYEGAPHLFLVECADAVNDRLLAFLDEHA